LINKTVDIPAETPNLERRISDLKIAAAAVTTPSPKLPVAPATTTAGNVPAAEEADPLPPPSEVAGAASQGNQLRRLIAISADPAPPGGPIDVPAGNRSGSFSVGAVGKTPGTPNGSPNGLPDAGGIGPAPAGDGTAAGGRDLGGIRVPGLFVSGGAGPLPAGAVVSGPPPPKPAPPVPVARAGMPSPLSGGSIPDARASLPSRPTRQLPEWNSGRGRSDLGFQPGKRVYTVYLNMPNLSSGSGSWVLRFAELEDRLPAEQIDLAAPVAVHKVDPGYTPDAVREKVQGQVVLHAIIRKDGHVERVEVLHSLDSRLDQRAIAALQRWEFQPATRNGAPVDLEAVVNIPFSLPTIVPTRPTHR
jgi:TonB family protein